MAPSGLCVRPTHLRSLALLVGAPAFMRGKERFSAAIEKFRNGRIILPFLN